MVHEFQSVIHVYNIFKTVIYDSIHKYRLQLDKDYSYRLQFWKYLIELPKHKNTVISMKIVLIKALEQWKLKLLKATFVQQYFPF